MAEGLRRPLRCVDFFAGIGGNHAALRAALARCVGRSVAEALPAARGRHDLEVVAVEVNDRAVAVYKHNFPDAQIFQKKVEDVPLSVFVALRADVWLMSPPCQPFSRLGSQQGLGDARSVGLQYILDLLMRLPREALPRMLFLENVKNFEVSDARDAVLTTLRTLGYDNVREYLFNPADPPLCWPNSRLRYYLTATLPSAPVAAPRPETAAVDAGVAESGDAPLRPQKRPRGDGESEPAAVATDLAPADDEELKLPASATKATAAPFVASSLPLAVAAAFLLDCGLPEKTPLTVQDFLSPSADADDSLLVPADLVCRMAHVADFCDRSSARANCFTKGYAHKAEGSGSWLLPPGVSKGDAAAVTEEHETLSTGAGGRGRGHANAEQCPFAQKAWRVRFFHSDEVLRLLGYPVAPRSHSGDASAAVYSFRFPEGLTHRQRWMLLGNSVNVGAVSAVLLEAFATLRL